jgi:predicted dehydrogenase/threonine dehydrogenase-like Zn-dependent dehydrogenase
VKQVLVRGGGVVVEDVPAPTVSPRSLLVRVHYSCVSVGTEMSGVQMSGLPLYRRALKQPHHAKRALELARDEGFVRVYKRVRGQLAAGLPTGYSAAGVVVEVGEEVEGFAAGDVVACAGAGVANHAEVIAVPVNLAVRVPAGLELGRASTVTLGAIALQGVRRTNPTLGETIGVIGLGILGQLTAQMLKAAGCRVLGGDVDASRVDRALGGGMAFGCGPDEDFVAKARAVSDGFGVDAVVITAASANDEIVSRAFQSCRKKGRVVLVGDVGLALKRHDIYEKELDFLVSTSYGPGRYDPVYEQEGRDYPIGYVRWTENRNMEEYLRLLADGRVSLDGLGEARFAVESAPEAYEALKAPGEKPLLTLLAYPRDGALPRRRVDMRTVAPKPGRIRVALVGAGSFQLSTHVPNLRKLGESFEVRAVVSRTGATAKAAAQQTEAAYATTDLDDVLADPEVDLVLISTRHDLHASQTLAALEAGKHVFVEKPLALDEEELAAIEAFFAERDGPLLQTGFNRRFAPAVQVAREQLAGRTGPLVVSYTMNAGYVPLDHWVHGPEGGGRNIGEACHVYDVFDTLTAADATAVSAYAIDADGRRLARNDNFVATITYSDGSLCTLTYTALGHRDHPKERMEVYVDGSVLTMDSYRSLDVAGRGRGWSSRHVDKGHLAELEALARALQGGGAWPIPLEEQARAMRIAFAVESQLHGSTRSPDSTESG